MTKEKKDHGWWKKIKIRKLKPKICSENKEHKFIARPGQKKCWYCERGLKYPPRLPDNYFVDPDELSPDDILKFL